MSLPFEKLFEKLDIKGNKNIFSFISFNYDLCLEHSLRNSEIEFHYPNFSGADGVPIYKLHGSLNWWHGFDGDISPRSHNDILKPIRVDEKLLQPFVREQKVSVLISGKIDDACRRVAAKIAFNYITFIYGIDFALRNDFDGIRRYVRYGEYTENKTLVTCAQVPILAYDSPQLRQTSAHIEVSKTHESQTIKCEREIPGTHHFSKSLLFNLFVF